MYFKRIEMNGFKSFADPVTIEFQDGITCIVGPNGSGKSNISDAIRWVLGEQSHKTLRSGKMEEVIFSGSSSRRAKGMAEVTLVIDNSTEILPIDYSEVAIRRRVFRSGESEYSINGNQCRRRDIIEMIMDTGIGVDGYSLIGQGKISDIISEKPESRREIFEEAAGVIKYKTQKEAVQRKLELANINLERSSDIIGEMEERLPGLKIESAKAKEAAELRDKHKELEINITLRNIEAIEKKNIILQGDLKGQGDRLLGLRNEQTELEANISAMRKQDDILDSKTMELKDAVQTNLSRSMDIKNSANLNEERQRSIEKDKTRLESEIRGLEEKIAAEEAKINVHQKDKDEVDGQLALLTEELNEKNAAAVTAAADLAALVDRTETMKNTVFDLSREKSNKETEIKSNEDLMGNFDFTKSQVGDEVEESKRLLTEFREEHDNKIEELETLSGIISSHELHRSEFEEKHEETGVTISQAKNLADQLKVDMERLTTRKKTIEEMESNYEGYNFGVKSLMKQSMPGVKGVVAELMKVPAGYETAIETALGATMQNIVTEDDASAKRCIGWLKNNKAGRVTFLPLDRVRDRSVEADNRITDEIGYDDYAVNKIEFDPEYKDIFGYLLGNVVIVDNLDNAVKISKQTDSVAKFVTLDGEVINSGGSITGGKFKNKSADLLGRRSEIDTLTNDILEKEKRRNAELAKIDRASEMAGSYMESIQKIDLEIRTIEDKRIELNSQIESLNGRIRENESRLTRKEQEFSSVDTDKGKYIGLNDNLKARVLEIEEEIEKLEKLMNEDSVLYEEAKVKAENANDRVTEVRLKVAEISKEKEAKDSIIDSINMVLSGYRSDYQSRLDEQESLMQEESRLLQDVDLEETITALNDERKSLEESLESSSSERKELRQKIEESELKLKSLVEQINSTGENKHAMEIDMSKMETRLTNLKDKLYEDFDITYVEAMDYRKDDFVMTNALKENRIIKNRLVEIGEVNPGSVKEYEELKERYEFQTEQRDDILKSMSDYERIVTDMDKTSKTKFKESFDKVVENFDETFKLMFGGGKGSLILEDPNNPLESGIGISAQPPGKVIKNINQMSGGEQTMVAIALMFSVLKAKPTPFCILDEVEAALDESNIRRFADYLVNFKEIQFAMVTHQKTTMEYADVLYGVTMPEQGITKVLSLRLGDAETDEFADKLDN